MTGSPHTEYPIYFTTPGTYTVWLRGYPTNAAGDSLHFSLAPGDQMISVTGFEPNGWHWTNESTSGQAAQLLIETPGPYTLTLWMREDGLRLDRILLTTDTVYLPTGNGPAESPRTGNQQTLIEQGGYFASPLPHPRPPASLQNLPFTQSPFAQDPTLLLLGPLSAAAPLAGRRKWRRSAWLILLILLALGFLATGTAIAADTATADQRPLEVGQSIMHPPSSSYHLPAAQLTGGGTITTTYTYDPLYRLTGAYSSDGGSFGYTYDSAGNRLTYTVDGTQAAAYTYNAANWLTQVTQSSAVGGQPLAAIYTYDANGNLLDDGIYTYTYDSANRLTQIASLLDTTDFVYNGDGSRVAQIENGLRTDYVQDGALPLPQVLTAQHGGTVSKYLRGLGLIGEQTGGAGPLAGPAVWQYHLPDALGSVRQVTDLTGQVLLTRRYDPFGGLQSASGPGQSAYGFAGEEQDPESDQLFLRARTYNPATGRFLQSDPVMGSPVDPRTLHHYAYAFNNPVNYTDPSGLMPPSPGQPDRWIGARISPLSYAPAPPTQGGSGYGYLVAPRLAPARSASGSAGQGWHANSDLHARQQSQGFRPDPCGIGSLLVSIRDGGRDVMSFVKVEADAFAHDPTGRAAQQITELWNWTKQNVRESWQQIKQNTRRDWQAFQADRSGFLSRAWQEGRTEISLVLDFVPIVGDLKSIVESAVGFDLAGNELSQIERSLMVVGGVAGMFTVLDEIADAARLGSKLLDNSDEVADVVRAGKGLENVDEVVDASQAINQADNLADALTTSRGIETLDEAADLVQTNNQLHNLDELTAQRRIISQEETRPVLSSGSDSALSETLDEALIHEKNISFGVNCEFNSFTAGTLIKTREGQKPIEELKVGDKILGEDPETRKQGYFAVLALTNHMADEILRVTLDARNEGADNKDAEQLNTKTDDNQPAQQLGKQPATMEVTPDHPVYVEGKGWVWAENLIMGDRLRRMDGGWAKILAIERVKLAEPAPVYNFTVEGPHTYFVLEVGALVHNTACSLGGLDDALLHLQNNLNILKERKAKFGLSAPVELVIQIEDYEQVIDLALIARKDYLKTDESFKQIKRLDFNTPFNKSIIGNLGSKEDFQPLLVTLHKNLNTLQQREAKFGNMPPLHLINQIDDYKTAINLAERGQAGQISIHKFIKKTESLILDHSFSNPRIIKNIRTQSDYQPLLNRLNRGLNILQEQKAKFGNMPPLHLINQIDDYKTAINLAERGQAGQISIHKFIKKVQPLIIDY